MLDGTIGVERDPWEEPIVLSMLSPRCSFPSLLYTSLVWAVTVAPISVPERAKVGIPNHKVPPSQKPPVQSTSPALAEHTFQSWPKKIYRLAPRFGLRLVETKPSWSFQQFSETVLQVGPSAGHKGSSSPFRALFGTAVLPDATNQTGCTAMCSCAAFRRSLQPWAAMVHCSGPWEMAGHTSGQISFLKHSFFYYFLVSVLLMNFEVPWIINYYSILF